MHSIDTTGMLHTCGKKLRYAGIVNGCHVLVCDNKKCDGAFYRVPVEDPRKLPFPWEVLTFHLAMPKVKVYKCKDCGRTIDEKQAKETFNETGRALCVICDGREHGIEV